VTDARVIQGDCREVMASMDAASVDAIVTDPPYGLGFMGKGWDHAVPGVEFWSEALRVAKPGAHLLAFGGTRLFHRLVSAVEDAGWEVRDTLMWVYGSGFPKSLDVSKAIDKMAGAEREVVGDKLDRPGYHLSGSARDKGNATYGGGIGTAAPPRPDSEPRRSPPPPPPPT
jgi:DNA modification methylase